MKNLKVLSLILSLGVLPLACNKASEDSDLSWGHLRDVTLNPSTPMFLINKGPSDVYKVCLAQYMVDDLPGFQEEMNAAINIWAKYLGRSINIQTTILPLPRPVAGNTSDSLRTDYFDKKCAADSDVVVGYAPFSDGSVGQTGVSYSYRSPTDITSFRRHLFLKDYSGTPGKRWVSLQDASGQPTVSEDLLTRMQERDTSVVAPKGTFITLPVLVHEFGHVWGLCDQYGADNCDLAKGTHSDHLDPNSIMASSSNIAKIFLTDDDITGIRALAKREGFNAKWPGTENEIGQAAKPLSEVLVFKINSIEKQGLAFLVNFSVLTSKRGGEIYLEYRGKGTEAWQRTPKAIVPDKGQTMFNYPDLTYTMGMGSNAEFEFRVRLQLKADDGTLMTPIYATL